MSDQTGLSDATLAQRIANGDRGALEIAFNEYGGAVKSMALRVLRDDDLAEDTVQDVFVSFWQDPDRFDPKRGSLRTFLLTLAHRRAVDTVRSREARSTREEKVPDDPPPAPVDEQVLTMALSASVREAVSALNEGEKEAITLAYFGGLTYIETAQRLDLPEGTVKSRIRTGMRKLSHTLAEVAS